MRLVHTSDWQIGKGFRFADDETLGVLQDQRLEAIARIGRLARQQGAGIVLVAGDVWDIAQPGERTLRQPIERMRNFPDLHWHLIPGNHDPHLPGGPWDRLMRTGLPDTVHLHLTPEPTPLGDDVSGRPVWLLPAVLDRRHAFGDPTATMDAMATPDGALRIGLAHGSVRGFGSDPEQAHNRIAADRAERSGLAYLALGDWHGLTSVGPRTRYSGTPETDGFDRGGEGGGSVLLLSDLAAARPAAIPHRVGRFHWRQEHATLTARVEIDALDRRLRGLAGDDPSATLVWLTVEGALGPEDQAHFQALIRDGVGSALRALRIDDSGLQPVVSLTDLAALGPGGALREAGEALSARAETDPAAREIAVAALQRLLLLARRDDPTTRERGA